MQKEITIILTPVSNRKVIELKEEIIREAVERNIQNATIITANLVRNTISVTSSDETFIKELSSNREFQVIPIIVPFLN